MTKLQTKLYWRAWAAAKKAARLEDADRALVTQQALGYHQSSKALTNRELDKVLASFAALAHPDNLAAQIAVQEVGRVAPRAPSETSSPSQSTVTVAEARGRRKRMLWWIDHHCLPEYIVAVSREKFQTADWRNLSDPQLAQLHMTLKNRPRAHITRARTRASASTPATINVNRNHEPDADLAEQDE